jgi:hypothetical protein
VMVIYKGPCLKPGLGPEKENAVCGEGPDVDAITP